MLVSTIVLMVAAVLSSIISSFFPHFSINYISIFVGLIIGLVPFFNSCVAPFRTEVFMYIVAPLIYFKGQSTRINLIGKRLRQIFETAQFTVLLFSGSLNRSCGQTLKRAARGNRRGCQRFENGMTIRRPIFLRGGKATARASRHQGSPLPAG